MPKDLRLFIQEYSQNDDRICFARNPDRKTDPFDLNEAFRDEVIDYILSYPSSAPLTLLQDVYKALTDCSVEAWSIDARVGNIAKLMLMRGRIAVITDYIEGARKTFDSECATIFPGCPKELAIECQEFAKSALVRAKTQEDVEMWQFAIDRFGDLERFATVDTT